MNLAGTVRVVGVQDVAPNPWNPQRMDAETFEKEKRSIRDEGFLSPIIVRAVDGKPRFQIIDGEHRYRAAVDLGLPDVRVLDLGVLPDHRAKALTLKLNDIRGVPDEEIKARLVRDLLGAFSPLELMETLPYDQNYYTQFPEFMTWAEGTVPDVVPPDVQDDAGVSVPMPAKPTYEGMTLLHFLLPNDAVREYKALVREVSSREETAGRPEEQVVGEVLLRLLRAEVDGGAD